jgi:hypothetical protein
MIWLTAKLYWALNLCFILIYKSSLLPSEKTFSELHSVCAVLHLKSVTFVRDVTTAPWYFTWHGEDKQGASFPPSFSTLRMLKMVYSGNKVFWAASFLLILYHLFNDVFTCKFCVGNTVWRALGLRSLASDCMRHEVPTVWHYITKHLMQKV